jgi:hypothetical protein
MPRYKAPEILRSAAYLDVRRNDLPCQIEFWLGGTLERLVSPPVLSKA